MSAKTVKGRKKALRAARKREAKRRRAERIGKASRMKFAEMIVETFGKMWPEATEGELYGFARVCMKTELDPYLNQIYFIGREENGVWKFAILIGIDGFRTLAEKSGSYGGTKEVTFNGGKTLDQCVAAGEMGEPRTACAVVRKIVGGQAYDVRAEVAWREFPHGAMHDDMPYHMMGLVAEKQALRRACPGIGTNLLLREETIDQGWVNRQEGKKTAEKKPDPAVVSAPPAAAEKPAEPKPKTAARPRTPRENPVEEKWLTVNGALHAEANRLKINVEALHRYIHARDAVNSISDLSPEKLKRWVEWLKPVVTGGRANEQIKKTIEAAQ